MTVTHNTADLIKRMQDVVTRLAPQNPDLKAAFHKIGMAVRQKAIFNYHRVLRVQTGRLINSISYEFYRQGDTQGVMIGSFNVPYAAVHEFGFRGTQQVGAHTRNIRTAWGRKLEKPVTATIKPHTRQVNLRPRPFLIPAFRSTQTYIIDTLREALLSTKK